MKWHSVNKHHFMDKGYVFSNMGDEFEVDAKDLLPKSTVMVKYICDYCNGKNQTEEKGKYKKYSNYTKQRKNGKDCCSHKECKSKKSSATHINKLIAKGKSLAEKYPSLIKEWDYIKNNKTPFEVSAMSEQNVWWICEKGHSWDTAIKNRSLGNKCPYCIGRRISIENCLDTTHPELIKEWNFEKNIDISPFNIGFGSNTKVWWKCSKGHEWESTVNNRTNHNNGCPYCSNKKVNNENSLLTSHPDMSKEWSSKNKLSPSEVTFGSRKNIWWICKTCNHEWKTSVSDRTNGRGCPACNESKGEKRIRKFLEINCFEFINQKGFNSLIGIGGGKLSYDFYLPRQNILIEYQGEFHDGKANDYVKQNLEYRQEHDKRKREYAEQNNINLLEIWYWDFERIEEVLTKELVKYKLISPNS
jgi:hypothetical protein